MPTVTLFFLTVAIWGTTWIAITFQTSAVTPEVGVALRFSLAAAILLTYCRARGISLRMSARNQAWVAALGALGFCLSYLFVYHAQHYIVSGLIAVSYAAMPLVNMGLARVLVGSPMSARVAGGGALGLVGIALVFWPEFARLSSSTPLVIGATLTAAAVLASAFANMVVVRNQRAGISGWVPLALGMAWGAGASWLVVFAMGRPLAIAWSWPFAASLLYLSVFGSVLAFGAYYTMIGRIGPARAAYVGVMSTVVALVISTFFEGYDWRWASAAGIALAVAGNVLALRPAPARLRTEP